MWVCGPHRRATNLEERREISPRLHARRVAAAAAAAFLPLVVPASAQAFITTGNGGWLWQNPLPMSTPLSDVCC